MFDQLISHCQDLLHTHPAANSAREYLNSRIDPKIATLFKFGWFPNQEFLGSLTSVLNEEQLLQHKLLYYHFNEFGIESLSSPLIHHNLILPFTNAYGKIIGIVGRSLLPDDERKAQGIPKYKNTSFSKAHNLFGLDMAKQTILEKNCVFIVEGQFDCIKAFEKGIKNVVAVGSSSISFEQMCLILRYTDNIILLLDNDEAGQKGMSRCIKQWSDKCNVRAGCLPMGYKDLAEFLTSQEMGVEEFKRMICK